MEPLVSIIVPIYNVEQYLKKCVDSIIGQTYRNLEIILVDDGSTDSCSSICDDYKIKESRVVVIHKVNGGLSDARNAGLERATGEYITFIDGDDWYAEDAIETLVSLLLTDDISIACMRNASVSTDYLKTEKVANTRKVKKMSSQKLLKKICQKKYSTSVCNKLFKKELWGNRRFLRERLNEDFLALGGLLMDDFSVATVEYAGYYYYSRSGSLTHSKLSKLRPVQDALKNSLELKKQASVKNPKLEKHFARIALYQARTLIIIMPEDEINSGSGSVISINKCLDECGRYICKVSLSFKDRIVLLLARKNAVRTATLIKRFNKLIGAMK